MHSKSHIFGTGIFIRKIMSATNRVSLHQVKTKLSHNLRRLENEGLASRADNYQSLLNAIAADIVNQRQHRISRKMVGGYLVPCLSITLSQLLSAVLDIIVASSSLLFMSSNYHIHFFLLSLYTLVSA